ncbi:TonB-dependent siderophore receptor [Sphingobacterium litopenaei]|uniref:TonB-dependent siderophore receptor n=1 Tax=Sphingobacterium litopenaei TaxID=2763500 RepID=A0ABR7YEZ1_9SPHI|nr:TonB-dependent siderophore receptor [Sphingobacterium litopenaei]MBD1429866.1 TonB-dependent siderophore receptor [Sphingobacterium litopenaei]
MKTLKISITVFCLFLISLAKGQQQEYILQGIVKTAEGEKVSNATIIVGDTKSVSDRDGNYLIKLKSSDNNLEIRAIGFKTFNQKITLTSPQTHKDLTLEYQNNSIDEVAVFGRYYQNYKLDSISGSLRLTTPILELPQNIQVISSDLMADQQVFDIVDGVTRNISGATRQGHWDNQYANLRMRGSKIPAFRNGMNIEASWGPTAEDASVIERIEFVKGPAGFMLANGEPGGFYNVVTKKPSGHDKGSVTFNMGSFNTYRGAVDLDGKLSSNGKVLYRFNAAAQQKDFHTKYNYSKRVSIAPVITYAIDSATNLTFEYTYQGSTYLSNGNYVFSPKGYADPDISNDFFYGDPSFEPSHIKDHSAYVYLDHKLSDRWKLHGQLAYFNFEMIANSTWLNYMKANGDMPRYYSIADEAGENRFGQFSLTGEEFTGNVRHRLLIGGDFGNKKFWGDFRTLLDSIPTPFLNVYDPKYGIAGAVFPTIDRSKSLRTRAGGSNYVSSVQYMSFYSHDELGFWDDKFRLSLGLRFTQASTTGRTQGADISDKVWSPRVGISYSILKSFTAYSLFDQSFVPVSGTDWEGNAFKPIRGNNLEVGLKKEWANGKWVSSISAYNITRENSLVTDPDPNHVVNGQTFQAQLGETTSKGIEVDITGEIAKGLNINANYALTDSKISKASDASTIGNITPNTAKHTANTWVTYRLSEGFFKGAGVIASVQTMFDRAVGSTKEANFKNYVRTDGGISYQRGKYNLSLVVNNLLDNRKLLTAGSFSAASAAIKAKGGVDYYSYIVEARRNMRIGIIYKF